MNYMVRNTDPETSHEAAFLFTTERLSEIQKAVLNFFLSQPDMRATDEELEIALRDKYPAQTTVSKRRTDLVRKGILRAAEEHGMTIKRRNTNNRQMIVWEVCKTN